MPFADKWIPTIMGPRRLIPNQGQFVTLDLQNHTMKFFLVVPKFTKKMVNFTLQTCLSSASNANTPRYEQVEKLSLCRNLQLSHRAQTSDRCAVARLDMSSVLCKKSSTQRRSLVHSHNHCTAVLVGGMWQRGSNVLFNVREGGVQFGLELLHSMSSQ